VPRTPHSDGFLGLLVALELPALLAGLAAVGNVGAHTPAVVAWWQGLVLAGKAGKLAAGCAFVGVVVGRYESS
jgi:hypothetical protein